jgi:hypothetical protein
MALYPGTLLCVPCMRLLAWQWQLIQVQTLQIFFPCDTGFILPPLQLHTGIQMVVTDCFEINGHPKDINKSVAAIVYIHHYPDHGMYVLQEAI